MSSSTEEVVEAAAITVNLVEPGEAARFPEELWVTVEGPDPLPDYRTIRNLVEERHGVILPVMPKEYWPDWGQPEDPYSELWVVKKVSE